MNRNWNQANQYAIDEDGYVKIRSTDPLFLSTSDNASLVIVTELLTERNYITWREAMITTPEARGKLSFINGTLVEQDEDSPVYEHWIKVNSTVVSWIKNSIGKEIARGFVFARNAQKLWDEIQERFSVSHGTLFYQLIRDIGNMKQFHFLAVCKGVEQGCHLYKLTYYIMIFASSQFLISHLPNFNAISGISLAAAIMSFSYCTIAWGASLGHGVQENVQYGYKSSSTPGTVFGLISALGNVAFAYAGHSVVLEIQATIPSLPGKPSKVSMWRGVLGAYIVVALCYFPVAFVGYWIFGNGVEDIFLISLKKPAWLIAMADMFVSVHFIGGYQIYAMPVFDMIETVLVRKLRFKPSRMLRFVARNAYVAFTMFFAVTLPFFDGLVGFFGGFALAPTTYFLPCIMWLVIYKPRKFSLSWFTNWICIILGVVLMVVAPIGGLRKIIITARKYKFYS